MAGREYDQVSKLYYMRARYYDPQLGRFITEDPIGTAGGLNLYAYAANDPINARDPSGLCTDPAGDEADSSPSVAPSATAGSAEAEDPPKPKCGGDDDGEEHKGPFKTAEEFWAWIDWALSEPFSFVGWTQGTVVEASVFSLYGHLSRIAPGIGVFSFVEQDQVIGYVGSTGRSTGPHLHFELRINGESVEPYGPQWHNMSQFGFSDPLNDMSHVTSEFGWRTHPISGERAFHDGMDIGAPSGTPVYAVGSGVVVRAGTYGGYGTTVVIWH